MAAGRPKLIEANERLRCNVPAEVLAQVSLRLYDPILGRVPYTRLGNLITGLLRKWLEEQNRKGKKDG